MAIFNQKFISFKTVAGILTAYAAIIFIALYNSDAYAQSQTNASEGQLKAVLVTGTTTNSEMASIGDEPLARIPISTQVISSKQIEATSAKRLADLNQFDASISDAYNAAGYWDYATVRGFVIDNKYNYRRDGLPINAETFIPLDNKERVEILKGSSGIQAGTSAPGGLVNYVVKRPTQNDVRSIRLEANNHGTLLGAVDLGGRLGATREFGYRLNAAAEKIDHHTKAAKGQRQLLAFAADWRLNADSILEAEIEYSRRSQPSVPGVSLTGNTLPSVNNALNINNQAWSQPVVLEGLTGSLTFEQAINAKWRWKAQLGSQQLTSQDRVAFPFGCTDSNGIDYYADRFCPNGDYDLYDYRSENERRTSKSGRLELKGQFETPLVMLKPTLGIMYTQSADRFQAQAYNYAGVGSLGSTVALPAQPELSTSIPNRREKSTELYFNNVQVWTPQLSTWTGVRLTKLNRASLTNSDSTVSSYSQNLMSRFAAASYQINPALMLYASYGEGVESEAAPALPRYTNAGQVLPALKSKQIELGMKGEWSAAVPVRWAFTHFNIKRPLAVDQGTCDVDASCTRQIDGIAKHTGFEFTAATPATNSAQPWQLNMGLTYIDAKRQGSSIDATQNGLRPTNVPNWILRLSGSYKIAAVPGLLLNAHLSHEGKRAVLPDNSIMLPAWTRIDVGASYDMLMAQTKATWTVGVDNVLNKRYYKESPYQFGHSYLFPSAPRSLRIALQFAL